MQQQHQQQQFSLVLALVLILMVALSNNGVVGKRSKEKQARITSTTALTTTTTTTTREPFVCSHDGYFPDHTSCSKYVLCSASTPSYHDCGQGLTWDAEMQLCGWADTIECVNGKRPWEKITDSAGGILAAYLFHFLCLLTI